MYGIKDVARVGLERMLEIQTPQMQLNLLGVSFVSQGPVQLRKVPLDGVCRREREQCSCNAYILSMTVAICPTS